MNPFEHKTPTTEQVETMQEMAKLFTEIRQLMNEIPMDFSNSGYLVNAEDRLKEAAMWANMAIVHSNDDQVTQYDDCDGSCVMCKCDDAVSSEDFILPAVGVELMAESFMPGVVEGVMVVEPADEGGG